MIDEIDPNAFVSQGAVNDVYGMGFDRMKVAHKKKAADEKVKEKVIKQEGKIVKDGYSGTRR